MSSWRQGCETMARSPELGRLRVFWIKSLREEMFNTDEFQSILFGLPPNCALAYVLTCHRATASTVAKVLARGADVNADLVYPTPPLRVNPLLQAVTVSRLEVIRLLLDAGARGPQPYSAQDLIFMAVRLRRSGGGVEVMQLLYDAGLQSSYRNNKGFNTLHYLTFSHTNNHSPETVVAIARLICERQPELLTEISNNGFSPLALLVNRQCASEWRDSPSERAALTRELTILLGTKEAKFRRGSRR